MLFATKWEESDGCLFQPLRTLDTNFSSSTAAIRANQWVQSCGMLWAVHLVCRGFHKAYQVSLLIAPPSIAMTNNYALAINTIGGGNGDNVGGTYLTGIKQFTGDYKRSLEITWGLLEITRDY